MISSYLFKAIKSPCCSCSRPSNFPECLDSCQPVNDYLVAIGDNPHRPTEQIDMRIAFPVKNYGNRWTMTGIDEVNEARDKLLEIKKQTGLNHKQIGDMLGLSQGYVSTIVRGVQAKMEVGRYEKIMGFEL